MSDLLSIICGVAFIIIFPIAFLSLAGLLAELMIQIEIILDELGKKK